MFLVYINDLTNVSNKLFSILYADDTNLFIQGKDINKLISIMNEELHKILKWLNINRLSLHINKTHFMVFKSQKSNVNYLYDALYINNMIINKVEKAKFLGVIIDAKLNWTHHTTYVKGKLSRGIGIICKARKVLIKLYYSFFYLLQYVLSRNCQMEFRFAHIALHLPLVLAVVGTGFQYESTEVSTRISEPMALDKNITLPKNKIYSDISEYTLDKI